MSPSAWQLYIRDLAASGAHGDWCAASVRMVNFLTKLFGSRNDRLLKQYRKTVARINAMEPELEKLDDQALKAKTQEFQSRLGQGEALDDLLPEA